MRELMKAAVLGMVACVAACAPAPEADVDADADVDVAAEEAAIREVDQRMLAAAQANDAAGFAAVFTPEGQLLFPNAPAVTGREAIQTKVAEDFAMPDFEVSWENSRVIVAESGDLAASLGTYELSLTTPGGPVEDRGKFITLWRKVDGQWMVAADMINTDLPMPGQEQQAPPSQ